MRINNAQPSAEGQIKPASAASTESHTRNWSDQPKTSSVAQKLAKPDATSSRICRAEQSTAKVTPDEVSDCGETTDSATMPGRILRPVDRRTKAAANEGTAAL